MSDEHTLTSSEVLPGDDVLADDHNSLRYDVQRIADGNLHAAEADHAAAAASVDANGVTTSSIADGAVTTPKIADGNIITAKLADGAITTAKLASSAVTDDKIADGTISDGKLSLSYIHSAQGYKRIEVANGSVHYNYDRDFTVSVSWAHTFSSIATCVTDWGVSGGDIGLIHAVSYSTTGASKTVHLSVSGIERYMYAKFLGVGT